MIYSSNSLHGFYLKMIENVKDAHSAVTDW
jgi:hypothetical protein